MLFLRKFLLIPFVMILILECLAHGVAPVRQANTREEPAIPKLLAPSSSPEEGVPKRTLRSRFALSLELGLGYEAVAFIPLNFHPQNPATYYKTHPPKDPYMSTLGAGVGGEYTFPVELVGSYYLIDSCQYHRSSSCLDLLVFGALQYQRLFYDAPVSSVQVHAGLEIHAFFDSQRVVAWMSRLGLGYGYFSYSPILKNGLPDDPEQVAYYYRESDNFGQLAPGAGFNLAEHIQHCLLVSVSTGLMVNLPQGVSLYALVGISPRISLSPFANYISLQFVYPMIGLRYRF